MIISASRRTDIPCYYSEWFINRLRAGFVLTRNPFNNTQLSRIPLSPDLVDCIVFWTKDAARIIPRLAEIDDMGYKYYFQFTLTPYGNEIECNLRHKNEIINTFIKLSKQIGKVRVLWRYDPIILNDLLTTEFHKSQFEQLCERLSPYTESVTVSFVDMYSKIKTPLVRQILDDEITELARHIGKTARAYGIKPSACCEKSDLTPYGIEMASCIDKSIIENICGCPLALSPDKNQREGCGCMESVDIGTYNTCQNGCVYCYANNNPATAKRRFESHDPKSEMLIGTVAEGEQIQSRSVKSNRR